MTARKSLRERVEAARSRNFKDLPIPALDLVVRVRPLSNAELKAALDREDEIDGAIDVLTTTCIGVYEVQDGKGVSPVDGFSGVVDLGSGHLSGTLPTFGSQELADGLGLGPIREVGVGAVVRAIVATKSDLAIDQLGGQVIRWSGSISQDVAATRGN
ncbi:MAG: hypothetical protein JWO69_2004 [Thermoleophilia bacterium]|nr:hypothetical protein [Thermoleophilia bacterium]